MEYKKAIVGRKHEQEILAKCMDSEKAEFVAVYGRRRIGKTYLVKQYFSENFDFYATGVYKISRSDQLKLWQEQLRKYSGEKQTKPKDWFEAFGQLQEYLETLGEKEKIVLFIDELPWLDTPKSGFIRALELFWNSWAAERKGLKLIVCGSATTWMTNKLLGDKGGLHNRVTRPIRLAPFTLKETEEYLQSIQIGWERKEVLDAYMILGGTPFYLSLLRPELSLWQNVDELFYSQDAVLKTEYGFLFNSLFNEATMYRRVVETLTTKLKGMTRSELVEQLKITDNGKLTEVLDNLVKCDFLRRYQAFGKKGRDMLYQLSDMYTLFYLRFVKNYNGMNEHAWSNMEEGRRNVWADYAFEQVCILHINQIRQALGISGIASDVCSWSYRSKEQSAQIDLIIDRSDKAIDLCEMKYSDHPYELKKDYVEWLRERRDLFREVTGTDKTLRLTMIASSGIKQNIYSSSLQGRLSLSDLFK
ncbi:MAG: ATP-binding protein [Marinilabiliaceae bacterium]|nr:AAA family ATPase [Bacteroidales bacterium]